jgi:amidohydrolase
MTTLYDEAQQEFPFIQATRRDLHLHPELGFQEFRTAGIVAKELANLGLEVHTGVAETGVVALLEGDQPGPVILARFDMDALPIREETGADYASQSPGVMHACGHDGHVASGLAVARLLARRRTQLRGSVKFVFQPAEEGLGGAEKMLTDGVLRDPEVAATFAMHLWNERPVGWLGITPGPLMAGSDVFTIQITGKGGHGALPQVTIDPVAAGAVLITALQTIISRNVSPLQSAVLTVARMRAGEAFNVIPQTAELAGTLRAFEPQVRDLLLQRMEQVVQGVATAMNCRAELAVQRLTPPVINDPQAAQAVLRATQKTLPDAQVEADCRTMISEDMAFLMERVPGCYFLVGSSNPEKGLNYGHHHPRFDFDEAALPRASALMAATLLEYLG